MTDQLDRLKAALADRYTIEREIGSGGMATVYLAEDVKHRRKVAVKVLRPDLAATLGPDRFLREIEIAAQLHHPHILPLYDSGRAVVPPLRDTERGTGGEEEEEEAGRGFLFYVMPYEEGQSLRDKLAKQGELPIGEAVRVLRDVVDALNHAHQHGVVHRDIKPENILLSGQHALVTDFGVAKAVSEATGREQLTTAGVALGTPAYMAPEQAAADPNIDQRADVYAVGVVAYELLTGRAPFVGTTAQQVLAAHMTERPDPVTKHRDTVPPQLEALVMQCLEKKPADRFQSAEELLPHLEALTTPSGSITPTDTRPLPSARPKRRWIVPAMSAAAVAAVVVGYLIFRFLQVGAPGTLIGDDVLAEHDLILVVEFQNRTDDSLLGVTVSNAVRIDLQQSGVVRVLGQEDMWRGLRRMGQEPGADLVEGVARELAEREGAKAYVTGDVSRLGAGYQLTARVVASLDETVVHTERVTAEGDQHLIQAVNDLGKQLRRSIGEPLQAVRAAAPLADVTTAELRALRDYMAASRAEDAGDRRRAITLLEGALEVDSAFAMAWNFLGTLHYNSGRNREASEAYGRAYAHRERLPEIERLSVAAHYHIDRGETIQAEAAYRQLIELEPDRASHFGNLSEIKLTTRQLEEAESLALRSVELDPENPIGYWNAVEAQIAQQRFAAADSLIARAASQLPGNPWTRRIRVWMLWAQRDFAVLESLLDSLEGSGPDDDLRGEIRVYRCGLAWVGGQLDEWHRCGPVFAGAALWELRYPGDTARASGMVDSMLAWDRRPYPGLIAVLAEMGRLQEAHQMLAEWEDAFGPDDAVYRSQVGRAAGSIAMAEGQPDSAVRAFLAWNRAPFVSAEHIYNRGLPEAANAHDRAGRPDSAIALYERALALPSMFGESYEATWYPHALRRLGELHESLGHREQAMEYYGKFIDLWKDADPELQLQVEAARAALERLSGEVSR